MYALALIKNTQINFFLFLITLKNKEYFISIVQNDLQNQVKNVVYNNSQTFQDLQQQMNKIIIISIQKLLS